MSATIPEFAAGDRDGILAGLDTAGCAVVHDVLAPDRRDAILAELTSHLDTAPVATDVGDDEFYPGHTKRVTALIAKAPAVRDLALHELTLAACDRFLLPNCERYHLHVASALVVGPGARGQVLHREDDIYPFFQVPRPHLVLASMWALSDFTSANGGTLIAPGSHRWKAGRTAGPDEFTNAVMPAGSVLFWLGGTLHGAGANTASDWRHGVFLSYSLGWLRQEENQYLDVPYDLAATLPKDLRALVGYKMHGGLGFYDPTLSRSS